MYTCKSVLTTMDLWASKVCGERATDSLFPTPLPPLADFFLRSAATRVGGALVIRCIGTNSPVSSEREYVLQEKCIFGFSPRMVKYKKTFCGVGGGGGGGKLSNVAYLGVEGSMFE